MSMENKWMSWLKIGRDIFLQSSMNGLKRLLFTDMIGAVSFKKTCARSIAELKRQVSLARHGAFYEQAAQLQRQILTYQPNDKQGVLTLAAILIDARELDAASAVIESFNQNDLKPIMAARLIEAQGDIDWLNGNSEVAAQAYQRCLTFGTSDANQRMLTSKAIGALQNGVAARVIISLEKKSRLGCFRGREWSDADPRDALPRYLVGLQLKNIGRINKLLNGCLAPLKTTCIRRGTPSSFGETAHQLGLYGLSASTWQTLQDLQIPRLQAMSIEGLSELSGVERSQVASP